MLSDAGRGRIVHGFTNNLNTEMVKDELQGRQCTDLTVDDAKCLVEAIYTSATSGLRGLAGRCQMCLLRCTFDAGIHALLPRLRADIIDFAASEAQWQSQCNELMPRLIL